MCDCVLSWHVADCSVCGAIAALFGLTCCSFLRQVAPCKTLQDCYGDTYIEGTVAFLQVGCLALDGPASTPDVWLESSAWLPLHHKHCSWHALRQAINSSQLACIITPIVTSHPAVCFCWGDMLC